MEKFYKLFIFVYFYIIETTNDTYSFFAQFGHP
jgi:hypothetical protein